MSLARLIKARRFSSPSASDTALILTRNGDCLQAFFSPASPVTFAADLTASNTFSNSSEPVISRYCSRSIVSRLILTASSPASRRPGSSFFRSVPFVVSVTDSIAEISLSSRIKCVMPRRTRGSPPVSLICRTPSSAAASATVRISS